MTMIFTLKHYVLPWIPTFLHKWCLPMWVWMLIMIIVILEEGEDILLLLHLPLPLSITVVTIYRDILGLPLTSLLPLLAFILCPPTLVVLLPLLWDSYSLFIPSFLLSLISQFTSAPLCPFPLHLLDPLLPLLLQTGIGTGTGTAGTPETPETGTAAWETETETVIGTAEITEIVTATEIAGIVKGTETETVGTLGITEIAEILETVETLGITEIAEIIETLGIIIVIVITIDTEEEGMIGIARTVLQQAIIIHQVREC